MNNVDSSLYGGFVKLPRNDSDNWKFYKVPNAYFLYMHLLAKANFEQTTWNGVQVKRGQFITSWNKLHEQTGISVKSIRTLITKFEKANLITRTPTYEYTIITLCDYDSYNGIDVSAKSEGSATGKATGKATGNNNRNINRNNLYIADESAKKTEKEIEFDNTMKKTYPQVWSMEQPLRHQEFKKLCNELGYDVVIDCLEMMENYKPLLKKNVSASRTIRNWIKKNKQLWNK